MSDNIFGLTCTRANYKGLAFSEAKKVLDPVTGNPITDIIIDAMKNRGNTELGDFKQALTRYFEIYFQYYDRVERISQFYDSFLIERGFPSRVDASVESIMRMVSDEFDNNKFLNITNKPESSDLIKIADKCCFVKESESRTLIDKNRPRYLLNRPSLMEQEEYCMREIDNGYPEGIVYDYVCGKLSGHEVKEELDGLVRSFVEAGLLTPAGEVTEPYVQKIMNFVACGKK